MPAAWRDELMQARGDQGARERLRACPGCRVVEAPALAFDIDRREDLARVAAANASRGGTGIP